MPSVSSPPQLLRAIGRWTLVALVLNGIVGSGIFGLPDDLARLLGPAAPWAYVIGALGIGIFIAVFAELASQFREAGGPYLYAQAAFGRLAGIQMGWFVWLVRLTSAAANANIFVTYLGEFWRGATAPAARATLMIGLIGGLAVVNVRGVRAGAGLAAAFTVAKLLPLALFVGVGLWLTQKGAPAPLAVAPTLGHWTDALVALVFAYGGFEAAVIPAGETKNPRRDTPFALFTALGVITAFYLGIHLVSMWALPGLAQSERPLADAARAFAGPVGAGLVALGAVISTYGWISGALVTAPRLTYALAERGDFPKIFAAVHPRFRTPHVSIVLWAILVLALALSGSFIWNAILSAVARLFTYGFACAALIQLRRLRPNADAFRVPGGNVLAVLGIMFCLALTLRLTATHAAIIGAVMTIATLNWLTVRRRSGTPAAPAEQDRGGAA